MIPSVSDLHMLVLALLSDRGPLHPSELADVLGLRIEVIDTLCADLQAAGMIRPALVN
jgi:DNA-binding MarR family transcriptional regulator